MFVFPLAADTLIMRAEGMARGTFGERLKRERELREVTLEEITAGTRIAPRFLEALENEEWEKLPGGVFNRGFVRAVSRYLGLDEEAFLAEYDLAHGPPSAIAPQRPEERIPSPPKWMPALLVLATIALLTGLFFGGRYAWRYYQARRATKSSTAAAQKPELSAPRAPTSPREVPADTNLAALSPPLTLNLDASSSAATHLTVKADGAVIYDADMQPGDHRRFSCQREFEVSASDSGAVLLDLNGQTVPPLGVPGSSGTMKLSAKDLRQADRGNSQP
jgi:cytoskeleton protein RodZ